MQNILTFLRLQEENIPKIILYISLFKEAIAVKIVKHEKNNLPKILASRSHSFSTYESKQAFSHILFSLYVGALEYASFHDRSLSKISVSIHDELVDHHMESIPMHFETFVSYKAHVPGLILQVVDQVFNSQREVHSDFLTIRTNIPIIHTAMKTLYPIQRNYICVILKEKTCEFLLVENTVPLLHQIVSHRLPHFLFKSRQNAVLDSANKEYLQQISELFSYIYRSISLNDELLPIFCITEGHIVSYIQKYANAYNTASSRQIFSIIDKDIIDLTVDGTIRSTNDILQVLEIITDDRTLWQK